MDLKLRIPVIQDTLFNDQIQTLPHYSDVFEAQKKWKMYFKYALKASSVIISHGEKKLENVGYEVCPRLVSEFAVSYSHFFNQKNPIPKRLRRKIGVDMRKVRKKQQIQTSLEFFGINIS